jgi:hypothetical protein
MSALKNAWSETHPIAKTGIVIVGTILGIYVAFKLAKGLGNVVERWVDRKEGGQSLEELAVLSLQGINPTLSDADVESMIGALKSELESFFPSDQVLLSTMARIKNKADLAKLRYRWGTQNIDGDILSLTEALADGLSSGGKQQLNNQLFLAGIEPLV